MQQEAVKKEKDTQNNLSDYMIIGLMLIITAIIQYNVVAAFDARDDDYGLALAAANLFFIIALSYGLKSRLILKYFFWISFSILTVFALWVFLIQPNSGFAKNLPGFLIVEFFILCFYMLYFLTIMKKYLGKK